MRYLYLIPILFLCGCAGFWETVQDPEIQETSANALGKILTGDTSGAIGQGIDLALLLLGYKGIMKGTKVAKDKLVNPKDKDE